MARQWTRRKALGLVGAGGLAALAGGIASTQPQIRKAAGATDDARRGLCGKMLMPGDAGFEQEVAGWNLIVQHHPKAVVVAGCPEDVQFAVRYAKDRRLPIAVQATGHGVSVPADGAMFINTRQLASVAVDPAKKTAVMGPGAKMKAVLDQAGPHGLGPLSGSSPDVGNAGFLSGGGLPVMGRKYGFGVDLVTAIDIVTVDGNKVRATPTSNADLFYAARGGKGNFGVITSIETKLIEQARLYGGALVFPGPQATEVLKAYLNWTKDVPDEMTSSIALAHGFPGPDGKPADLIVALRIGFTGSAATGEELVRPLRALNPVADTVQDMPYSQLGTIHNEPPDPAPSFYRSALLRPVDNAIADRIMGVIKTGAGLPPGAVELRHMGGALSRQAEAPNPIGFRDSSFHFFTGIHVPPDQLPKVKEIHAEEFQAIEPWNTGSVFPNFLGYNDTAPDKVKAAYPSTDYTKLRSIKRKYDPRNMMRVNFNIPPA